MNKAYMKRSHANPTVNQVSVLLTSIFCLSLSLNLLWTKHSFWQFYVFLSLTHAVQLSMIELLVHNAIVLVQSSRTWPLILKWYLVERWLETNTYSNLTTHCWFVNGQWLIICCIVAKTKVKTLIEYGYKNIVR